MVFKFRAQGFRHIDFDFAHFGLVQIDNECLLYGLVELAFGLALAYVGSCCLVSIALAYVLDYDGLGRFMIASGLLFIKGWLIVLSDEE